jgi:hypothetical protein
MRRQSTHRPLSKGGRPSTLTAAKRRLVIDVLGAGAQLKQAAAVASISPRSLRRWIARGEFELRRRAAGVPRREAEEGYATLAADVRRAQAFRRAVSHAA